MLHRSAASGIALAAAAALWGGACARPADIAIHPPVYEVPSPARATYEVVDTLNGSLNFLGQDVDLAAVLQSTLGLAFEPHADGTLAAGTVEDFDFSLMSPEDRPGLASEEDLHGSLSFVIGPLGHVELLSHPEIADASFPVGPDSPLSLNMGEEQESPFEFIARDFVPRFPDRVVVAGDAWTDTVTLSPEESGPLGTDTTVYTYTLLGDTVVDGRSLLHIAVSAAGEQGTSEEMLGVSLSLTITTGIEGFFLWDADRGLVTAMESAQSMRMSAAAVGLASISANVDRRIRVRLVD